MNTLLLLRRIRDLPREIIWLIYEYDDTFRRIFKQDVLLIRQQEAIISEYTEEQFYEAVVARKKGDFLGQMLPIINCLDLNYRLVPYYDYHELKYSFPYRHEVEVHRSIRIRRSPFQKLSLHYPSFAGPHMHHFAIWHQCPTHIADVVNAYTQVRQRKYMNTPVYMLNLYGIIDLVRFYKCTLIKKKYYDRGTYIHGYDAVIRRVNSRKHKRVCKTHLQCSLFYDLTLFQLDDGTLIVTMDFQRLWMLDATFHNLGINLLEEIGYLNDVVHDLFQVRKFLNSGFSLQNPLPIPRVSTGIGPTNFAGFVAGQLL